MIISSAINKTSPVGYEYVQIIIDGETIDVPKVSDNTHYQEIQRQVEAGDLTIEDAD